MKEPKIENELTPEEQQALEQEEARLRAELSQVQNRLGKTRAAQLQRARELAQADLKEIALTPGLSGADLEESSACLGAYSLTFSTPIAMGCISRDYIPTESGEYTWRLEVQEARGPAPPEKGPTLLWSARYFGEAGTLAETVAEVRAGAKQLERFASVLNSGTVAVKSEGYDLDESDPDSSYED